eukprot:COSAG01_NODE_25395_length_746_cov_1.581144_1_plen_82_part_00
MNDHRPYFRDMGALGYTFYDEVEQRYFRARGCTRALADWRWPGLWPACIVSCMLHASKAASCMLLRLMLRLLLLPPAAVLK